MNKNLTFISMILDRSGSMSGLVNDTIGGYNSFIESQQDEVGEALLTTVLFDNHYEILHNGVDIQEVRPLTRRDYFTRGTTALMDAIGKTINSVQNRIDWMNENDKPSKVIFVITTDGAENASREFSQSQIKKMIEQQTELGWQFIFLGANIDAVRTARSYGISEQSVSNYTANSRGTESIYNSMSKNVASYRGSGMVLDNWQSEIK